MQVVIDKSYLQGTSSETIRRLCGEHTVLFIETLLYELLTSEKEAERTACLAKFPETAGDVVVLIPRVGPLFRYEMQQQRPASPLIDHREEGTLEALVAHWTHRAPSPEWTQEVQREVDTFRLVATGVSEWCPPLRAAKSAVLSAACDDLKRQACSDAEVVRNVYRSLDLDGCPCAALLDPSWALFRWVQMHLLFGLDYIRRYGFADLAAIPKRIENDIHDLQYALFGTLCGALATRDKDIAANFTMACPTGVLLS